MNLVLKLVLKYLGFRVNIWNNILYLNCIELFFGIKIFNLIFYAGNKVLWVLAVSLNNIDKKKAFLMKKVIKTVTEFIEKLL